MMNSRTTGGFFRKWPIENIIADFCFIIVNLLFMPAILSFTRRFFGVFLIIAVPFQLACLFIAPVIGFYKEGSDKDNSSWFNKTGSAIWFSSIIFSIAVGFAWFLLPLEAFKQISGKDIANSGFMPFVFIGYLLFSLIAVGYGNYVGEERVNEKNELAFRCISTFIVIIFILFLEAMLKTTINILTEYHALDIGILGALVWAILAFLPLRLLLLLRPPFSRIEFFLFFLSTGFFVYRIMIG